MRRLLFAGLAAIAAATLAACSSSTPEAAPASTARVGGPLSLIVVSDGATDELLLEWSGGPENATKWQYRQRPWANMQPQAWTAWADVPRSDGATRSYRRGELNAGTPYDFQVRAVSGSGSGEPSPIAETGTTHDHGDLPRVHPDQIVEGDGRTQWGIHYLSIAIVIPDGVRLVGGGAFISDPCPTPTAAPPGVEATPIPGCSGSGAGTDLIDLATGSVLTFSVEGEETNRHVVAPAGASGDAAQRSDSARRVHDLFDQLMDSVRVLPE